MKTLKGARGAKCDKLVEVGVKKIADMEEKDDDKLRTLTSSIIGISLTIFLNRGIRHPILVLALKNPWIIEATNPTLA